ncbi:MAG: TRAP transporter large permease [Spirochaetales bacterium]|jgi:tripartite ATP-independent transporter DctM subunit|nr:TRAP transporter large permease [Spirochaetales bacterium]
MNDVVIIAAIVMLVCMFLKVPVFVSVLAGSVTYFTMTPDASAQLIAQRFTSGMESVPLLAVPFFICAGVFMNYSGITGRIMDFCAVLTGRMAGGLAQVNILLSTLMGGLSGSNIADAAMEAKMLVPEMEKNGLPRVFSTVVTAFSSIITPLIPPGIQMIIYGTLSNVSIGKIFMAGISVGALTCLVMMAGTMVISKKRGYKPLRTTGVSPNEFFRSFIKASLPLCLPVIIIGGIRVGVFTPTEAGAVAVIYAVLLGLVYKDLNLKGSLAAIKETVITTGSIALIIGSAAVFAWILTKERVPQTLTAMMVAGISNKYVFLIVVNLFLLIVGMFIEGTAATIVLTPLLAPIAAAFGINEVQFTFIFIFNLSIGCITPPMGVLMFVTCGITGCKTRDFLKEAVPYFAMLLVVLLLVTFVPAVSVGIVDLLYQ